jgi:nanoRNase/pAp phosphatase (c-di-AMP/oligoRNAs hydrolase)
VCRIKEFTLLDRMRPPVLNIAVCGQGMAYPDDVAFIIVESAVCVICDTKFIELTSEFERERLVVVIIIDHFSN